MTKKRQRYEIGMVGLGDMGRNLVLDMADHGCAVAGYDKDQAKVEARRKESAERNIRGAWLPANLIQAQRDYFGAHTYERIDAKHTFHTEWGMD
jgi:6-phosphogluconate dehydrogenase